MTYIFSIFALNCYKSHIINAKTVFCRIYFYILSGFNAYFFRLIALKFAIFFVFSSDNTLDNKLLIANFKL